MLLMRNMALAALRQLGFSGQAVAGVLGLTENYVATLYSGRSGTGRRRWPGRTGGAARARSPRRTGSWRGSGARPGCSDAEIGRRLGVAHTTISRRLGPTGRKAGGRRHARALVHRPGGGPRTQSRTPEPEPGPGRGRTNRNRRCRAGAAAGAGRRAAGCRGARAADQGGRVRVPVCGGDAAARVPARAGAGDGAAAAGARDGRDAALLSAVSMCFALGAATTEQFKHLAAGRGGAAGRARRRCRGCGRCGRSWPRSLTAPTRWAAGRVRGGDAGRGPGDLRGVLRR